MVRVCCISDTHLTHRDYPDRFPKIPECDILIHAGDATYEGTPKEIHEFLAWFQEQDAPRKIFIAGNHDFLFQRDPHKAKLVMNEYQGITYLEDSFVEFEGLKIYGSPWQPWFQDWAFNLQRGDEIRKKWDMIPDDTDILVTHGPPLNVCDLIPFKRQEHVGCWDLADVIKNKLPKLKLHVCGHIHSAAGVGKLGNAIIVNAAICDEAYKPTQFPIVVHL